MEDTYSEMIQNNFGLTPAEATEHEEVMVEFYDLLSDERDEEIAANFNLNS